MTTVLARLIGAVGLLATIAVVAMLLVAPELPGIRTLGASAAVGLAGWLYLDWPAVSAAIASKGGAELARAAALLLLLAGIAIAAVRIADNLRVRWDLSPAQIHSVQPRTLEILASLEADLTLTAWFVAEGDAIERAHRARWMALAEAFAAASPRLTVNTADPDVQRRQADLADVRSNGVVIVSDGDRTERLYAPDEESMLNALMRVAAARDRTVYVTAGSGERGARTTGPAGLAQLAGRLRALGLAVQELDMLRTSRIPEDAAAVLLIDPAVPLGQSAAGRLAVWVEGGGALLIAAERGRPTGLERHLAGWGLALADGFVVDPLVRAVVGDATTPLVAEYGMHASVRGLRSPALFSGAAPVVNAEHDPRQATVHDLALTSELAWGETGASGDLERDAEDLRGPLSLLSLVELHPAGEPAGMVALAGDADWLSDPAMQQAGNGDLAIRVIGHLGRRADLVRLPPREVPSGTLDMDWMARVVLGLTAVLLVPGLCFATGAGVWMWRRRL